MIVDFHVHSTASDGTFAPRDIAADAARGGFAAIALTDHDNCDGIDEFLGAETGLKKVAGVELSIEPGVGFDKFHLLALGIDPANESLKAFLKSILEGRDARNERIVGNFRRLGIEMVDVPKGVRPVFSPIRRPTRGATRSAIIRRRKSRFASSTRLAGSA